MFKRKILILSLILVLTLAFNFDTRDVQAETFDIRVYTDTQGSIERLATDTFFELTKEKVDYDINVQPFLRGELFDSEEHISAVRSGIVDIAVVSPSWASGVNPIFELFELPFLFDDINHFHEIVVENNAGDILGEVLLEETGIRALTWYSTGARWMFLNERIESLEDLKGINMRSPGARIYIDMMETIGISPTTITWAEVFTSLETGLVEGVEAPPTSAYEERFHEVTNYAFPTNHMLGVSYLIIRDDLFQELPLDLQQAMEEAAYETAAFMRDQGEDLVAEKFKDMQEETGMELIDDVDPSPIRDMFDGYHMKWAEDNDLVEEFERFLEHY